MAEIASLTDKMGAPFPQRPSPEPQSLAARPHVPEEVLRQLQRNESSEDPRSAEGGVSEFALSEEDREGLKRTIEDLNQMLTGLNTRLKFGLFAETDQLFVQVIDTQSDNVLRTMPFERLLKLRQRITDSVGVLLDEEA